VRDHQAQQSCGVARGKTLLEAYERALECDPVSAFGGIVALNQTVNRKLAEKLNEIFLEIVVAPDFAPDALPILQQKKDRRLLRYRELRFPKETLRFLGGDLLIQDADAIVIQENSWKVLDDVALSEAERRDLIFAFTVCKHVKSNAIVVAKDEATLGIGGGADQPSRRGADRSCASWGESSRRGARFRWVLPVPRHGRARRAVRDRGDHSAGRLGARPRSLRSRSQAQDHDGADGGAAFPTLRLRAIFFDLDETLLDTSGCRPPAVEASFRVAARAYPQLEFEAWRRASEEVKAEMHDLWLNSPNSGAELLREGSYRILKKLGIDDRELAAQASQAYYRTWVSHLKLFSEVPEVLAALRGRFRLGIISNGPSDLQRYKLKLF
jgi:hypothetical protein